MFGILWVHQHLRECFLSEQVAMLGHLSLEAWMLWVREFFDEFFCINVNQILFHQSPIGFAHVGRFIARTGYFF